MKKRKIQIYKKKLKILLIILISNAMRTSNFCKNALTSNNSNVFSLEKKIETLLEILRKRVEFSLRKNLEEDKFFNLKSINFLMLVMKLKLLERALNIFSK